MRGLKQSFEQLKREGRSKKADKRYNRQYAHKDSSSSEGKSSRAALYTMKMGAKHKQAAHMQTRSKGKSGHGVRAFSFSYLVAQLVNTVQSKRYVQILLLIVVSLASLWVFLFPSLKEYYLALRKHDQLQAELTLVQARNKAIEEQVESLKTPEGVKEAAHRDFGWVEQGENAVYIEGVGAQYTPDFDAEIPQGSVPAPSTWYSPVLDTLFGYPPS